MANDPQQKAFVDKLEIQPGGKAVIAGTIIGDIHIGSKAPIGPDQRNRLAMLKRVRADWIDGVLKQSLYMVARIELGLEARADAVESALDAIVQVPDRAPVAIPPGTSILNVFDSHDQALLILGEPGTGKTTLLLELADALLDRALENEAHPIPAVFNLSTWALKREPLASWLVSELNQRSGVSKKLAQRWVDSGEILPLLDGLDEVDEAYRPACLDAINEFRREWGLLPMAVCSRIADFESLHMKLRLHGAVVVQPLSRDRVYEYLSGSTELTSLHSAAREDSSLAELLETPLMLWVAMLAYRNTPVETIKEEGLVQKRQRVFASFVSAMFERRAVDLRYGRKATLQSLSWLASILNREQQTIFYLENLRSHWLPTRTQQWFSKVGIIVGCWVVCGLFGLISGLIERLIGVDLVPIGNLVGDVFSGVVLGGLLGALSESIFEPKVVDIISFRFVGIWSRLPNAIRSGLITGLIVGLIGGLISGLITGLSGNLSVGLKIALGVTLSLALTVSLSIGLVTLLISQKVQSRGSPNQGTRDSIMNAFSILLIGGLIVALIDRLSGGLRLDLGSGMNDRVVFSIGVGLSGALVIALNFGMVGGLMGGGIFALRHFVLRFVLWRGGVAPLNYVAFLNYASERLFLRKVGGGYIFTHRMLLEYFASFREPQEVLAASNVKAAP